MAARDPLHGIVDSRITRPPPQGAGEEEEDERCERERYASPTATLGLSLPRQCRIGKTVWLATNEPKGPPALAAQAAQ